MLKSKELFSLQLVDPKKILAVTIAPIRIVLEGEQQEGFVVGEGSPGDLSQASRKLLAPPREPRLYVWRQKEIVRCGVIQPFSLVGFDPLALFLGRGILDEVQVVLGDKIESAAEVIKAVTVERHT